MNPIFILLASLSLAAVVVVGLAIMVPFVDHFGGKVSKMLGSPLTRYWDWAERFIEKRGW